MVWRDDKLPILARQTETGTILVEVSAPGGAGDGVVVYARVSSRDQRADLDRRVARLTDWAAGQGLAVGGLCARSALGSTVGDPKLRRVLSDPSAMVGVVEHLDAALAAHGRRWVVTDPGETVDDLVRDMIEVLMSMCSRRYGRRGARNRAMRAMTAAENADVDAAG